MLARSPKLDPTAGIRHGFGYYAGFSPGFVQDALAYLRLPSRAAVLDPWNGSGTTTSVVHQLGYRGFGIDLNPAMSVVAKARLLLSDIKPSHLSFCETILHKSRTLCSSAQDDPLNQWAYPLSAGLFRSVASAIGLVLASEGEVRAPLDAVQDMSSLAAFYYVALFRTFRRFLVNFRTSNPTWTKLPSSKSQRIRPSREVVWQAFRNEVRSMFDGTEGFGRQPRRTVSSEVSIQTGTSLNLPLDANSIDVTIGSPPYCTRIDYAIATRPELAVLGMGPKQFERLRTSLLGSALTKLDAEPQSLQAWGRTCTSFLSAVRRHSSHGSRTYYHRYHILYFDRLYRSLSEIRRVLKPGGKCVLVVQDSRYKGIHNDLQAIVTEMQEELGLSTSSRKDFYVSRTKASINTRSRAYSTDSSAVESVIVFSKGSECLA